MSNFDIATTDPKTGHLVIDPELVTMFGDEAVYNGGLGWFISWLIGRLVGHDSTKTIELRFGAITIEVTAESDIRRLVAIYRDIEMDAMHIVSSWGGVTTISPRGTVWWPELDCSFAASSTDS